MAFPTRGDTLAGTASLRRTWLAEDLQKPQSFVQPAFRGRPPCAEYPGGIRENGE